MEHPPGLPSTSPEEVALPTWLAQANAEVQAGREHERAGDHQATLSSHTSAIEGLNRVTVEERQRQGGNDWVDALGYALTERADTFFELDRIAEAIADFSAVSPESGSYDVARGNLRKAQAWWSQLYWSSALASPDTESPGASDQLGALEVYRTETLPYRDGWPSNPLHSVQW